MALEMPWLNEAGGGREGANQQISSVWSVVGGARSAATAHIPLTFTNGIKDTTSSTSGGTVNEVSAHHVTKSHSLWKIDVNLYIYVKISKQN